MQLGAVIVEHRCGPLRLLVRVAQVVVVVVDEVDQRFRGVERDERLHPVEAVSQFQLGLTHRSNRRLEHERQRVHVLLLADERAGNARLLPGRPGDLGVGCQKPGSAGPTPT